MVGFELPATSGAERRLDYYRSEVECVALEPGRADVRFYLPPEIVKRDSLHGDPKYWGVEVTVEGKPLLASRAAYSSLLAGAEQRKNFQKRGAAAAILWRILTLYYGCLMIYNVGMKKEKNQI